jgi:outer membrane immunogenic protein
MKKMKRYLLASTMCVLPFAASAAPAVPFTWAGFYVGGSGGLIGQGGKDTNLTGDPSFGASTGATYGVSGSAALFGLDAGYNYQMGAVVFGIEADISAAALNDTVFQTATSIGSTNYTVGGGSCTHGFQSRLSSLGTVRGRIGYAFDRTLFYATGGFAYGRAGNSLTDNSGEAVHWYNSSGTKTGWVAGGGIDYAVTNNWIVRCEVLYADLGTTTATNGCGCRFAFKNTYTLGRVGLNYKF